MDTPISTEYCVAHPKTPVDSIWRGRRVQRTASAPAATAQTTLPIDPEVAANPARPLRPGEEIGGRYRVCKTLGRGSTSMVYLVEHRSLGTRYALKLLHPAFAHNGACLRGFVAGIRRVSGLEHDNVVRCVDLDVASDDRPYLVMEYIPGEDLQSLTGYRQPWPRVARILDGLCAGLAAVHELGVIHRDVKPSNLRLSPDGGGESVKLIDFGVATTVEDQSGRAARRPGPVVGSPAYMSPEQARGGAVCTRSDLYAVGVIAYELLTGERPLVARTTDEMLVKQLTATPRPLRQLRPDVSPGVERLIMQCLEKRPNRRPASASELRERLAGLGNTLTSMPRA